MLACLSLLLTAADFDLASRVRARLTAGEAFAACGGWARARTRIGARLSLPPVSLSAESAPVAARPSAPRALDRSAASEASSRSRWSSSRAQPRC